MGIIKSFSDAIGGVLADQWKDIITARDFDEHTVVSPGYSKGMNNGRGSNFRGSDGVISNGSKIYIPENTAAVILDRGGIEDVITEPGGYEYNNGEESIFKSDDIAGTILKQVKDRFEYGGQTSSQKRVVFVNLREIRNIKFGTKHPLVYHDKFYDSDLEVRGYGTFSIKVIDPEKFIRNYVPANVMYYSFDDKSVRTQIIGEFLQSFIVAVNTLSSTFKISDLPSQTIRISSTIAHDPENAGTWKERFGFEITKVAIENIEFSDESRELVKQYSTNKMNVNAYDDVSQRASNISAQQKVADGIKENGLGDGGGTIFGMNFSQNLNSQNASSQSKEMSFDEQMENLKKLKELLDAGILTQEEFDIKKKEILGL